MSLILDGTNGLSDVDGTAAAPAIRGTDANTGIFFGTDIIGFSEGGAEAMRIDSSGQLGIGTSSPAAKLDVSGQGKLNAITFTFSTSFYNTDNSISNYSAGNYLYVSGNSTGGTGGLYLQGAGNQKQAIIVDGISTGGNIAFQTNGSERARIDSSGNLLVGTTTQGYGFYTTSRFTLGNNGAGDGFCVGGLNQNVSAYTVQANNNTGTRYFGFITNGSGTSVGTISFTSSATAYNTSSDYRLKNTIAPMTGALAKVALLKPCTYKWNLDGSDGQGFIAHELDEVVPQCVSGEKDAVDAEGNPQYQGIDTSFLVATLTAAIQEQQALITALTTRITALEGAAA